MNWFVDWFDSPYYHCLYKHRDEQEAELFIDNLINHLEISKKSKIIDIACGKGRHAKYFNQKGMDVVGIDLSPNNISLAKKYANNTLRFSVHDMRKVFKENHFDVATNLFTSFGYFEKEKDEKQAIESMAKNLKSEGILIIDFMNVNKVISNLVSEESKKIDRITFNIKRKVTNTHIIKNIEIINKNERLNFQERVKIINLYDFTNFVNNAGLKILTTFGSYKMEVFNKTSSDRLILICKK